MIALRLIPGTLCGALLLAGLFSLSPSGPILAQTGGTPQTESSDEDTPLIDLGPLLDTLRPEAGQPDIPSDEPVTIPEYERATGPAGAPRSGTETVLLPLQANGVGIDRILRLSGERSTATLTVDVAFPDAAQSVTLSYRNSINVLPDRSELMIRVNGTEIPPITPGAFEGFENIDLPSDLLVEGRNEIEVTASQAHRIFCGPEATFQIWTEIDLAQSGVRVSRADLPEGNESFAMALAAQMGLQGSVPVRIAPEAPEETIHQIAMRLSGVTGIDAFSVTRKSPYDLADTLAPIARITVIEGTPQPARVRRGADGAMVLVLVRDPASGSGLPDLDAVLPPTAPVPDIGLLQPGVPTALRDLKFTDTSAYNRYSEQRLPFRLPDDWLMLSSAEATLRLTYSFATGLPEGALMLVKVNDTTVRLLPLDEGGGEVLAPLDIGFSANLLSSGPNELNFVTIVPGDPADLPCPVNASPLMSIIDDSTLLVPPTPEMSFIGLRPALTSMRGDEVRFAEDATGAVATDDLALALSSTLRPVEGREPIEGGRLVVVDVRDTEDVPLAGLGLSRRELESVLMDPTPASDVEVEAPMIRLFPVRAITNGLRSGFEGFLTFAKPGDGPLNEWLAGRNGMATLLMPDPQAPNDLWLVVAADTDPVAIASALAHARLSPYGPRGRVSILTEEGTWQNWQDADTPPMLKEPLTFRNFRAVAGNYASWSPLYFSIVLFVFTILSVILALIFVVSTRGKRKR